MLLFKSDKDLCAICLDEKQFPIVLICGHSFCEECILTYLTYTEIRSKCPLCRTRLERKETTFYLKLLFLFFVTFLSAIIVIYMYCL